MLSQRKVLVYLSFEGFAPRRLQLAATFPSPGTGKELQSKVRHPGCRVEGTKPLTPKPETRNPKPSPLRITRAALQGGELHVGLLKQSVLSWRAAREGGAGEGGELGGEGSDGAWESMEGCVLVSALRSLFRISEMQGVGVGDMGSVRVGGDDVCTVRITKDERGEEAEGDAEEGAEDYESGDALTVSIDVKIKKVQMGAMTQESVRRAIVDELGFQARP